MQRKVCILYQNEYLLNIVINFYCNTFITYIFSHEVCVTLTIAYIFRINFLNWEGVLTREMYEINNFFLLWSPYIYHECFEIRLHSFNAYLIPLWISIIWSQFSSTTPCFVNQFDMNFVIFLLSLFKFKSYFT